MPEEVTLKRDVRMLRKTKEANRLYDAKRTLKAGTILSLERSPFPMSFEGKEVFALQVDASHTEGLCGEDFFVLLGDLDLHMF